MRTRDLTPKRTIEKHRAFYDKIQKEIAASEIKLKNARSRRGLYKPFYQEFKVLLDYATLKYKDEENISFKWVGAKQQGKRINYDGEIYYKNELLEKVEVTAPLRSVKDRTIAKDLYEKGSSKVVVGNIKEKLDENNLLIEIMTLKKNSMNSYDETITLVVYMEDMKYYYASLAAYKKSLKKLENDLKEILYQFKEVYIIENIYMYSKKKLIRIK